MLLIFQRTATVLTLTLAAACAKDPATDYYTLHASAEPVGRTLPTALTRESLGVGPVRLPAALGKSGIVSLKPGNQVIVSAYNIWAGNLASTIADVVTDNLTTLSGNVWIRPHPWDSRTRPSRQLQLHIVRFHGSLGGEVVLRCKWTLLDVRDKRETARGLINLSQQVGAAGYRPYVATMNDLINELSRELLVAIEPHY